MSSFYGRAAIIGGVFLATGSVAAFATPVAPIASPASSLAGRITSYKVPTQLVRPFKGHPREILVYLPQGYDDPANQQRRYPVVYLLHGSPGNPSNFFKLGHFDRRLEEAVASGSVEPTIFVLPDGNYAGEAHGDCEWANSADRRDRFEDWVVKEVTPWADRTFRTRADRANRFLAGVSEGGFGSVNLALRNPSVFGGSIALSGYYDMRGFGWGHIIMNDSDAQMTLNSPLYYVPEKTAAHRVPNEWRSLKMFLGVGGEEKPYADHTKRMGQALQDAGVNNVTVKLSSGKHDWGLWTDLFFQGMHQFLPGATGR